MKPALAIKIVLGIITVTTLFHLAIVLKLIPYDIAWGGRLTNDREMYAFETVSIVINLVVAFVILIKGNYFKKLKANKFVNGILWGFLVLLVINTVGNIFAKTNFEKGFTIVTIALVLLLWIILRDKKSV